MLYLKVPCSIFCNNRLWVLPKDTIDSAESQQVSYINIVPARNEQGGFDDFGETIRKFNAHLRRNPLPGKCKVEP